MKSTHVGLGILSLVVGVFALPACGGTEDDHATQSAAGLSVPQGYAPYWSSGGVRCFRKPAPSGGAPDFVCAANLTRSRCRAVTGATSGPTGERQYRTMNVTTAWSNSATLETAASRRAFTVNSLFFATGVDPSGTSYGFKQDGVVTNQGFDTSTRLWAGRVRNLNLFGTYATITTADQNATTARASLQNAPAPNIWATLAWDAPKNPTANIPRTFLGILDDDRDGRSETLLVYASRMATQSYARQQLVDFGANAVVQFDGGGSTQMIVAGTTTVASTDNPARKVIAYVSCFDNL